MIDTVLWLIGLGVTVLGAACLAALLAWAAISLVIVNRIRAFKIAGQNWRDIVGWIQAGRPSGMGLRG